MKEQTIPFSYSGGGGGRTLVNNPYNFIINDECEAYGEYTKINMYEYAKRMIPNYKNITEIPDGHLPKDLDKLGYEDNWYNAFAYCRKLTSLPDPFYNWNGVTNIQRIFYYCNNLNCSIPNIPNSVNSMADAFYYCSNLTGSIPNIPNNITNMSYAFYNCRNLTGNIPNIPNSTTNIAGAFDVCTNLTGSIPNIPNSVTSIVNAFAFCYNLTGNIPNIPNSVTNMSYAFDSCYNITGSIPNIPNSVANIGNAFAFCYNLTGSIPNIPNSVINMASAFRDCYNLNNSNVYIYGDNLYEYSVGLCFDNIQATINIYCHANTNTYKAFEDYVNQTNNVGHNGPRYLYTFE